MFLEQQISIRTIPEESCDTEDCSNGAENSALITKNKLHKQIYSNKIKVLLNGYNISQNSFSFIFDQRNTALVSLRDFMISHGSSVVWQL